VLKNIHLQLVQYES